jgi:hypothetical protein
MAEIMVALSSDDQTISVPLATVFGTGIARIEQTVTSEDPEIPNEITCTLTNGQQSKFYIKNGKDGFSPSITIEQGAEGYSITVTDEEGSHEYSIIVDSTLDAESANPIQNQAVATAINNLLTAVATKASLDDTVHLTAQTLTTEQKSQARTNIDVPSQARLQEVAQQLANGLTSLQDNTVHLNAQTLTDAQKTQARANIGSASADDLTAEVSRAQSEEARIEGLIGNIKGIYWVTYGTTTKAQIYEAIENGLYPVVNYYDSEGGVRMIAPLVYSLDQYEFYSVQEREVIWFRLGTSWTRGRLRDRSVKYESQSLTTSEKAQARTNIGAITASEAPVQSVNGQTGAVTIPTATTSSAGLMSSQDKSRLDDLYADYSSALTALGV